ncbi:hypothetical protein [Antarcticimicrobium luteum]|uniref:Uncharacterized protein n=1 Tax=Antarcticimicrobium luteum TaxID=2547397 RepID=A0A4R5UVD4_9RHOB|nr:hypothetical protein [Antarcticimicrobium luteum]TDK43179.1 hypothetical protein E1832_18185 [Antarcticimicrobium luteum]
MSASAPDHASDHHGSNHPDTRTTVWVLVAVVLFLALWATSVALFGIPGLYIPALALVPVIYLLLITIAWG